MVSPPLQLLRIPQSRRRSLHDLRPRQRYDLYRNRSLPLSRHVAHAAPPEGDASSSTWPGPGPPESNVAEQKEADPPSKFKLWLACIKPLMYSVAITPMVLGAVLAYLVTGVFNGAACGNLTLGGILVIAWLNLR